ncbi:AraC family transcriptional regulator [Chitinophaga horti]|uniref:AraC family transcriptional regulator n=1 Tax=Chitinophaga horti TaxID=2920382 RepID=A0ABY6J7Q3_9BACT|nr:AraC family transcriptional regulator [Chitinophaga horti]UYQ95668.1 AraC family transcriptional regulator [Chitinophaga horti]
MIFEFSAAPEAVTSTTIHPEPHDFPQMIIRNAVSESRQATNRLLQQQENAIYSTITKHHFQLQNEAHLCMRSTSPLINLFYTIKGKAAAYHEQLGNINLDEGQYFLYYLPAGEHPIQLTACDCITMKVEVDMKMLATLKDQHVYLEQFHQHAQNSPLIGWRLPRMETCKEGQKLLGNITSSKLENGRRAMFMHRSVSMLLALYIDDLSRNEEEAAPRYIYSEEEVNRLKEMAEVLGTDEYRKLKIEQVVRRFGFSHNKAVQGIKWLFKKSLRTLKNERIAKEIARRLIESEASIEQIIDDMELGEPSNTRRMFRKIFGQTPSAFRRDHRREQASKPGDVI